MKMVLGIFNSVSDINSLIIELYEMGCSREDISIITRKDVVEGNIKIENDASKGISKGAKVGGVIGGLAGLLAGIGFLTLPGIGALFIAGPLAAALGITGIAGATASGAITGALAGGFISALKELGLDELKAKKYEDAVKEGKILIGVNESGDNSKEIEGLMKDCGAEDTTTLEVK